MARREAVRVDAAPDDSGIAEDKENADMLDGLVEMTLPLPPEGRPYG